MSILVKVKSGVGVKVMIQVQGQSVTILSQYTSHDLFIVLFSKTRHGTFLRVSLGQLSNNNICIHHYLLIDGNNIMCIYFLVSVSLVHYR